MNILILNWRDIRNPKSGGAEIVTHEHAKAWVREGHAVTWFSGSFNDAKASEQLDGITIVRRGKSFLTLVLAPFFYIRHRESFDIVIDEIHGIPYATPLYVHKPIVAFIHEVAGPIWDIMYPLPINLIGKFLEEHSFRFYTRIPFWTDAESTNDDLIRLGIPKKNCLAIPCAIEDTALLTKVKKERDPTFIFVSRLVKMKGIEDVIAAFTLLAQKDPTSRLWIVGGGEEAYVSTLKELVNDKGLKSSVTFFGRVSDAEKKVLLRKSHILLHASVKEGFGLVVLEAGAQETPAVVYDVHGLRDVVENQKSGIVLAHNTSKEMAKQAEIMLENHAKFVEYQKHARKRALSFTWDDITKQSMSLLKKTVNTYTMKRER